MRRAMSMIELVVAIVVMGIAVVSLPLILVQTQRSTILSLEQEVILAAKSRLAFILSHEWDTNSYESTSGLSRVLDTSSSSDADVDFNTTTLRRKGHVSAEGRRRLGDAKLTPTLTTSTNWGNNALADIDDFDGKQATVTTVASDMDYTFTAIDLNSTVNYLADASTYNGTSATFNFDPSQTKNNPTNIKMITINAHATGATTSNITLRAFASNIGESTIMRKTW